MNNVSNTRQELTTSENAIRRSVNHYIELAKCAFEKGTMLSQHNALCQLLIKIWHDYPDGIALKPANYHEFPQVHLVDYNEQSRSRDKDLNYNLFLDMYQNNIDFCDCMEVKGNLIFYLTLSIWYEICDRREKMDLERIKYDCTVDAVTSSIKETPTALMLLPSTGDVKAIGEPLPHFSMEAVNEEALGVVLQWLSTHGWISGDVTLGDWLYRLTGKMPANGAPSPVPIKLRSLNQCRFLVKNLIFPGKNVSTENWQRVKQIFAVGRGNINNVQRAYKDPSGCIELSKLFKAVYNTEKSPTKAFRFTRGKGE